MTAPATAVDDRILSVAQVCERLGVGRSTLIRLRGDDDFPKPRQLGPQRIGWRRSAIDAWFDAQPSA